jgi:2-polyprenyl-3-methyl-5-hydroxy-6-metoxy-1,4-benzoquinol methylase
MDCFRAALSVAQRVYHSNFRRGEECATLIKWLEPAAGDRVLDVGCGDGYFDVQIARSGAVVTGIDVDRSRLSFAQRFNKSAGTGYVYMDAERMSFAQSSFDKAISFCVVEHFERDEQVLRHLSRVLRPGGRLVLSADSLSNPEITQAERARHRERYSVHTFYTEALLREKLARSGFELEDARYVLSSRLSLALARFSWTLDDLPRPLGFVTAVGHLALATAGRVASDASERVVGRRDSGLTLLARARNGKGALPTNAP